MEICQTQRISLQSERSNVKNYKSKRTSSDYSEDIEGETKFYLMLLYIFGQNLNKMIKTNEECLGEMQLHQKIKISKQQQQYILNNIENVLFKKDKKIYKESFYRNTLIIKHYHEFTTKYKQYQPNYKIDEQNLNQKQHIFTITNKTRNSRIGANYCRPEKRNKTTYLPLNQENITNISKTFKRFKSQKQDSANKHCIIYEDPQFKQENLFLKTPKYPNFKNKEKNQMKAEFYKTYKHQQQFKDIANDICSHQSQIFIYENQSPNGFLTPQSIYKPLTSYSQFLTKRVLAFRSNLYDEKQKKIIREIQQYNIESKLRETTIRCIKPITSNCYKPKNKYINFCIGK